MNCAKIIIIKCEPESYERFKLAIQKSGCKSETNVLKGYVYLFVDWEKDNKTILATVNELMQKKEPGYRFALIRESEDNGETISISNCEDAFEFMIAGTGLEKEML